MSSKEQEASPAYLWYPKDVLSSGRVESLTAEEECWYRRALDRSWLDEGIPSDPATCARYIGKGCTAEAATKILTIFFEAKKKDEAKMVNARQEKERKLFFKKRKQKSEAGKLGMRNRWKQKTLSDNSVITEDNISIPISIPNKEEIHTHNARATEGDWGYPMQPLIDAFPDVRFTPGSIGFIEAHVKPGDEEAWAKTIDIYRMNYDPMLKRYLPDKTANLLSVFDDQKAKIDKEKNGSTKPNNFGRKRTDQDVFAESADFYANYDEQPIA